MQALRRFPDRGSGTGRRQNQILQSVRALRHPARGFLALDDEWQGRITKALREAAGIVAGRRRCSLAERQIFEYSLRRRRRRADRGGTRHRPRTAAEPWVIVNALIGLHRALIDYVRRRACRGSDPSHRRRTCAPTAKAHWHCSSTGSTDNSGRGWSADYSDSSMSIRTTTPSRVSYTWTTPPSTSTSPRRSRTTWWTSTATRPSGRIAIETRLHVWIDLRPLPRPVRPNRCVPSLSSSFPAVRPVHVLAHASERRIDVACIERLVERAQSLLDSHARMLRNPRVALAASG